MAKVVIFYTEAGGGHKRAAMSLCEILTRNDEWQLQLINPFETIGSKFDLVKKKTGFKSETLYNKMVTGKPLSILNLLVLGLFFKLNIKFYNDEIIKSLVELLNDTKPDVVLSVTPFINNVIQASVIKYQVNMPYATLITDYSECIKGVWIVSKQQIIICATHKLIEQALKRGIKESNIYKISGMVVSPKFYEIQSLDKNLLRKKLGLAQDIITAIVMFGAGGSYDMLNVAKKMCRQNTHIQIIFVCGNDTKLRSNITNLQVDYPTHVLGYIDNVHEYMRCADFFIGKPGGISISEAIVSRLPLILKSNLFTLPQERYNAEWVKSKNIGIVARNFIKIEMHVQKLISNIELYRENLKQIHDNGIFEIPGIIKSLCKTPASIN